MAVDAVQLVRDQLEPVISKDPTLDAAIVRQVEAKIALQGWTPSELTEQQEVYISVLATKGLVPRLLIWAGQRLKAAKGGPAEAEWQDLVRFLEALQRELTAQVKEAAKEADPEDVEPETPARWPGVGVEGF